MFGEDKLFFKCPNRFTVKITSFKSNYCGFKNLRLPTEVQVDLQSNRKELKNKELVYRSLTKNCEEEWKKEINDKLPETN